MKALIKNTKYIIYLASAFVFASCEKMEQAETQPISTLANVNERLTLIADTNAFYISPSGKDTNPGSLTAPFQTLEKARETMRSSNKKKAFLRAGTYSRSETFILTDKDNNTIWSTFPGDPANSAIVDGKGMPDIIDILGGSNIIINGLTVRNFTSRGIGVQGGKGRPQPVPYFDKPSAVAKGNTIINNIVENGVIKTPCWERAGINTEGTTPNTTITNNLIRNTTGYGIGIWSLQKGDDISGLKIENNVILNCGSTVEDGGAIYIIDPYSVNRRSTYIYIQNNFIRDYGTLHNDTRGIYIDNETSLVIVEGNVVSGEGSQPFIYHGGSDIKVSKNIFDIGASGKMSAMWHIVFNENKMLRNTFTNNAILSSYPVACTVPLYEKHGDTEKPEVRNNLYFNYSTGAICTGFQNDGLYDLAPVTADPLISGHEYTIEANSPLYTKLGFPRTRPAFGPAGYTIPDTKKASTLLAPKENTVFLQAEQFDSMNGIVANKTRIEYCDNGDWVAFNDVNFGQGVDRFTAHLAVYGDLGGQKVEIRIGSPTGRLVGTLNTVTTNGQFADQNTKLTETLTGVQTIYIKFVGRGSIGNFDYFKFAGDKKVLPATQGRVISSDLLQAESYDGMNGVVAMGNHIGYCDNGDWVKFDNVSFGAGKSAFSARLMVFNDRAGQTVEVRVGSPEGRIVGSFKTVATNGEFKDQGTVLTETLTGTQTIYIKFAGGAGVGNFDYFRFTNDVPVTAPVQSKTILLQAESFDSMSGIVKMSSHIGYCDNNDWIKFSNVDFGTGKSTFLANMVVFNDRAGQKVEVRIGSPDGRIVGSFKTAATNGEFKEQGAMLTETLKGTQTIYIKFVGGSGVGNFDYFKFTNEALAVQAKPVSLQAESFDGMSGVVKMGSFIGYCDNNDWVKFNNVDFGAGLSRFTARGVIFNDRAGQKVEVRLGSPEGKLVGTIKTAATNGEFRDQSVQLTETVKGNQNVYIKFAGGAGVGNFDYFRFD